MATALVGSAGWANAVMVGPLNSVGGPARSLQVVKSVGIVSPRPTLASDHGSTIGGLGRGDGLCDPVYLIYPQKPCRWPAR